MELTTEGKNIRRLREARGWYQEELAQKLGVSQKAVSAWEKGRTMPRLPMLIKMSEVFNCKISEITDEPDLEIREKKIINEESNQIAMEALMFMQNRSKDFERGIYENSLNISSEATEIAKMYDKLDPNQQRKVLIFMIGLSNEKG